MAPLTTKYALIYLNSFDTYDMFYISEGKGGYLVHSRFEIPNEEKLKYTDLPHKKTFSKSDLKEYLQSLKYMIRKDKYPCETVEIMSSIFPTVKMEVDEFSDTVLDAILLALD